jgi:hypothetical protein
MADAPRKYPVVIDKDGDVHDENGKMLATFASQEDATTEAFALEGLRPLYAPYRAATLVEYQPLLNVLRPLVAAVECVLRHPVKVAQDDKSAAMLTTPTELRDLNALYNAVERVKSMITSLPSPSEGTNNDTF